MKKIINYLKAVKEELSKVNWPTKKETIRLTLVVVILTVVFVVFLGPIDFILSYLLKNLIS